MKEKKLTTRILVEIAMLAAIATILMFIEFPLPFLAPPFYKFDFSELPVLIGGFAIGPWAGVVIELLKVVLHMLIKGSPTMGVGDLANFLIGISLVLPAALIYKAKKTRKRAAVGMAAGTVCMAAAGAVLNAFVLLPVYAKAFQMPISELVAMGAAVNSRITGIGSLVMICVTPFNLLKGIVVSVLTFLVYKRISRVLKHD